MNKQLAEDLQKRLVISQEQNKFLNYSKKFSTRIQGRANRLVLRFGEQTVALEEKE